MLTKKEYYDADKLDDGTTVQAILNSMADRGFCRPQRPYSPPEDLQERLKKIIEKHMPQEKRADLWEAKLSQPTKVRFLAECVREFDHDIPNYEIASLKTARNVLEYFSKEVDGLNSYDRLVARQDKPDNLHVLENYVRFHPDRDTMFNGVTAYPGAGCKVTGLRTRKKYDSWSMDRSWPFEVHTSKRK
ncbi:39S ribosomal protein L50, mitochondrial isoform X2 [Galendromus occidentalis]|nr:39S ribosomal protein L50, mitochondrial isoform X2 [Galendromus occidentalis]